MMYLVEPSRVVCRTGYAPDIKKRERNPWLGTEKAWFVGVTACDCSYGRARCLLVQRVFLVSGFRGLAIYNQIIGVPHKYRVGCFK
jgi:hypothetical protein